MNNCLKQRVMEESRHQFIYGYEGKERTEFLKSLEIEYPVKVNVKSPMAIYMENYSLPKVEITNEDVDKLKLNQIYREYFNISIISNIIEKIINQKDLNINDDKLNAFLQQVSVFTADKSLFGSLELFFSELNESLDFYLRYHHELLEGNAPLPNFSEIKVPFIMPELLVPKIKKMLNNDSYFGVIIDKNDDVQINTIRAINDYVTSRINRDLSMQIACEPDKWTTYYDFNGNRADSIHDYGEVEFDNSSSVYIKKISNRRYLN